MVGFWRWYDRAARIEFASNVFSIIWDWRPWAAGILSSAITFLWAAIRNWDPLVVWLASLAAFAFVSLIYIGIRLAFARRPSTPHAQLNMSPGLTTVDAASKELAGVVQAMRERAAGYDFHFPLASHDPFIEHHAQLKNSTHPIWTDPSLNQLRRDFLNRCERKGEEVTETAQEYRALVAEITEIGERLSSALLGRDHSTAFPNRMAIIEFMQLAAGKGWSIAGKDDLEGVDLLDGLRQAGADGIIKFWGRLNRYGNRTLIQDEPYTRIEADHWKNFQFDWGSVLTSSNNMETQTYNLHETRAHTTGGYVDSS